VAGMSYNKNELKQKRVIIEINNDRKLIREKEEI